MLLILVLFFKMSAGKKSPDSSPEETKPLEPINTDDEAAAMRKKVMSEMGRKGGQKSKRNKVKPKEGDEADGV